MTNRDTELPEPLFALLLSTDYFDFNAKECNCLPYKYCYGMGDKRACDVEDVEKWKNKNPKDYEYKQRT